VHGSLDRGQSFARVGRRLSDRLVVCYDRRGYQGSRARPPAGLGGHVEDLLEVMDRVSPEPVIVVGHSLGGDVAMAAALRTPERFAALGVFEPPMPWLGFRRAARPDGPTPRPGASGAPDLNEDPTAEVERFFKTMMGEAAWHRLPEAGRAERRADGAALVDDLRSVRREAPLAAERLEVPLLVGRGGRTNEHHRQTTDWLTAHVPGARLFEIPGAGHGAHLSHPDAFAEFVDAADPDRAARQGPRSPDAPTA
jgi:pimeloyl-ACP methyl ester carboxylesterase